MSSVKMLRVNKRGHCTPVARIPNSDLMSRHTNSLTTQRSFNTPTTEERKQHTST